MNTKIERKQKFLDLSGLKPVSLCQSWATTPPTELQIESVDFTNFDMRLLQ